MSDTLDQFMKAYEQATDGHALQATLALVDDDAVYFFSDETVYRGKQAIERVLRRNFALIEDEAYAIHNLTWLARSETVAACVYDYTWSGSIRDQPASGSGRGTTVLRRSADGAWKMVHEHLSKGKFAD